ncbi:sodium:solute symporter family transporter [Spiribacter halobius]|uniref:Sodium:proline symporter n=1 Tax=Sediminicurvatus halobius TaxID=2182432 RepID=A0A2U2N9B1_9GAMM|nr:sodium:proline symporter [Spiribacter halobius]PWG65751.1 sodium:proline symporter [Spiribacter halobius]UEX77789.1 sodium:proline symporter [Spiribacter halobius]
MPTLPLPALVGALLALAVLMLAVAPRVRTAEGFFRGWSEAGVAPGVFTLTLSQVTTWIFARSLLNAGILGYFYGIAGALAYTAYYASFLTGWLIVDRLRFRHGADSVQAFLHERFGRLGTGSYNLLVGLRLASEVFANLLVVGIVFGAAGSVSNTTAILAVTAVTVAYSMSGGLRASLRTDVVQMLLLGVLLAALTGLMLGHADFGLGAIVSSSPDPTSPGWILLAVAALQVLSYPLHDPVMMDRGFLAARDVTRRSFLHAFWLSGLCILAFGVLGVFAGLHAEGDGELLVTLERLLGTPAMLMLALALVISAASTLDSTFASAAKLVVMDMGLGPASPGRGRLAVAAFALLGLALTFTGSDDLYAAVAVSGTAALGLAPVIVFSILGGLSVARWSLGASFVTAFAGAALYFLESSGYTGVVGALTGLEHDYAKLLAITVAILAFGFLSFALGLRRPATTG